MQWLLAHAAVALAAPGGIEWRNGSVLTPARASEAAAAAAVAVRQLNCSTLVRPVDISPKRSPQAVHSLLAWVFRGRAVVEAGTRYGDGMACWARTTRNTVGMELDRRYCGALRARKLNVTVVCRSFFDATPDADVYTWWAQPPQMTNTRALEHLASLHHMGRIRPRAEAIFLLDLGEPNDRQEFRKWSPRFGWHALVRFDERDGCRRFPGHAHRTLCGRAAGTFAVCQIALADMVGRLS